MMTATADPTVASDPTSPAPEPAPGTSPRSTRTVGAAARGIDIVGSVDDVDRLRLTLLRLARRIRTSGQGEQGEVTPSQLAVLATIVHHGRLTIGQIAEHEHVQPPAASKIVAALERHGYVERTVDPDDRRCNTITTTGAGADRLDAARAAGRSWLRSRLAEIDDADVEIIAGALPALERLLGHPD